MRTPGTFGREELVSDFPGPACFPSLTRIVADDLVRLERDESSTYRSERFPGADAACIPGATAIPIPADTRLIVAEICGVY